MGAIFAKLKPSRPPRNNKIPSPPPIDPEQEKRNRDTLQRQNQQRIIAQNNQSVSFMEDETEEVTAPIQETNDLDRFYEVLSPIGEGQFGKVYKMKRREDLGNIKRPIVAMKMISILGLTEGNGMNELNREIESLRVLHHRNIIRLFEVLKTPTSVYLALEFCKGGNLYDYVLDHGALNETQTQYILWQLLRGLAYAHQKKYAHRDIKPENIFLSFRDSLDDIKLGDWGFAKQFSDSLLNTSRGTPAYISPEMINEEDEKDERTDLWSLGVMSYQLITGELPFDAVDEENTFSLLKTYEKIQKIDYSFNQGAWVDFQATKKFISSLLVPLSDRPYAINALNSPYFESLRQLAHSIQPSITPSTSKSQVFNLEKFKQWKTEQLKYSGNSVPKEEED